MNPPVIRGRAACPPDTTGQAGFTILEVAVVLSIMAVLAAVTVMMMPGALATTKADSGATRVVSVLRTAREQAIGQRRNVRVTFTSPNQIVVSRVEVPGPAITVLTTVNLEDGVTFRLYSGVPDTPDVFGRTTAMSFGTATTMMFTSEGGFVDQDGDPLNGTVFLGKGDDSLTARAVSVFGPTALIRQWRWDGSKWTN